ncbi:hypothetical protein [Desulfobacter sp.]|uniref:hypothetical protein n=1 Tax=Desulfobacter sp. TaxID=2294 RepID=UPI002580CFAA|nr:hypothetical protein [Desulfobacter sp.]
MKKHLIHTLISAMVFWGVYGPSAALSAEDTESFLKIINEIREDPYNYAKGLGYEHDFLIGKGIYPETKEFKPYETDSDLTQAAVDESASMASEALSESTDPPVYRFSASTGGVVSFFNFMSREEAFIIVINYLFKKELDNESFDHILSKDYSSAGIAISAGKVGSGNAWFVAICLRSAELVSEIQMLNLINQLRADPEKIWEYTDRNPAEVWGQNILELIYSEYNPLFFDASLSEYARAYSSYLLNGTYQDPLSDTQTAMERVAHCGYGYEGDAVQESYVQIPSVAGESSPPVDSLFVSLIYNELIAWPTGYVVFLKDFQDVGFSMSFQEDESYNTSELSFVVGKKAPNASTDENADINNEQTVRIYGVLFSDIDGKGLYAPGYELIKQTVKVYDDKMQEIQSAVTDNAGHFFMELPANQQYYFTATIDDVLVSWEGNDGNHLITTDQFVKLTHTPTPDVP